MAKILQSTKSGASLALMSLLAGLMALAVPANSMEGSGADWGARNPGACPAIRLSGPPTRAQVATMLRCRHEVASQSSGELRLMENLTVTVGAPIPFVVAYNRFVMPEADARTRVYPIRGSYINSICKTRADAAIYGNPDLNCYETDVRDANGVCWRTSFGDWRCLLSGASVGRREPTRPPQALQSARPR